MRRQRTFPDVPDATETTDRISETAGQNHRRTRDSEPESVVIEDAEGRGRIKAPVEDLISDPDAVPRASPEPVQDPPNAGPATEAGQTVNGGGPRRQHDQKRTEFGSIPARRTEQRHPAEGRIRRLREEPISVRVGASGVVVAVLAGALALPMAYVDGQGLHVVLLQGIVLAGLLAVFPLAPLLSSLEDHGILSRGKDSP